MKKKEKPRVCTHLHPPPYSSFLISQAKLRSARKRHRTSWKNVITCSNRLGLPFILSSILSMSACAYLARLSLFALCDGSSPWHISNYYLNLPQHEPLERREVLREIQLQLEQARGSLCALRIGFSCSADLQLHIPFVTPPPSRQKLLILKLEFWCMSGLHLSDSSVRKRRSVYTWYGHAEYLTSCCRNRNSCS